MSSVLLSLVQLGCVCMLALLSINQTKKITKLEQELTEERLKNLYKRKDLVKLESNGRFMSKDKLLHEIGRINYKWSENVERKDCANNSRDDFRVIDNRLGGAESGDRKL